MKYIYRIHNTVTNETYVGQTNNPKRRWREHLSNGRFHHYPLYRSMRYWGDDKFKFTIIEECSDYMADEREQYWISYYDSERRGYNQVNVNETMRQKRRRVLKR